jgi:hypothetical protein
MGSTAPGGGDRRQGFGTTLAQRAAEVFVKAGLEALIASGVLAAAFLGGLAVIVRDLPFVLTAAGILFPVLFLVAIVAIAAQRHRHRGLVVQEAYDTMLQVRVAGLETLVQQLRAVDLEMTALRCHGRTDPEQSPEEARRDCARVVLRPVYNQLLNTKPGHVSVAFHVWDEATQRFRHVVGTPEFGPAERDAVARLGKDSAAGWALGQGEPNIIPDVASPEARHQGWRPLPFQHVTGSSLQVPVYRIGGRTYGEWLGVISADCTAVSAFTHADGNLLQEFAVKLNVIYEGMFEHGNSVDAATATP